MRARRTLLCTRRRIIWLVRNPNHRFRAAAIRSALDGSIDLPAAGLGDDHDADTTAGDDISDADLQIPLGDAPVPGRGGQPCPASHPSSCPSPRPPARHPRQAARRRADHRRPPRLRAALVPPATAALALVFCVRNSSAISCEGVEDLLGGLPPHERLRVVVPVLDPGTDVGFQGLHALVHAAADHLAGQEPEPPLVG